MLLKIRLAGKRRKLDLAQGRVRIYRPSMIRRQPSARLLTLLVNSGSGLPSLPSPQQNPSQGSLIPRKNLGPQSAFIVIFLINIEL
jgi:hypothetical protein